MKLQSANISEDCSMTELQLMYIICLNSKGYVLYLLQQQMLYTSSSTTAEVI